MINPMTKSLIQSAIVVGLMLSLSGCLKTRAQLKDSDDEDAQPRPAQVQDVQPQGQYVIDEVKSEITRLTGRLEDLERANRERDAQGANTQKEELKKLEARLAETEQAQAQMIDAIKKMQATQPVAEQPELFEKAKAEQQAGNHEAAVESFSQYLKTSKAKHTEEATFLRGESFFALKQYKKAIMDFSKFPEKYSKSRRMAAALMRIAASFEALGMAEDAKGFYQELVDKFPKTAEGKKAKAKLK
jgi:TolA-binding protein